MNGHAHEVEQLQARVDWLEDQIQYKNEVISHLLDKLARLRLTRQPVRSHDYPARR